ncbi:ribosome maturation factor RimP [Corynebacterium imitans]|uniref:ribosome maturation factor RimP n=1 Tax=Corynebacterium imitans TaxID=156978 RepID=UPI00254AF688|nr:ribosome maturation factor RimP [Corynebacterium imitans]MDK8307091.1 ribosome maturation factor RimP [Corynebacterium imitans]MDK8638380.1 ribosome maturation factor RimP [Corynebacterium imitans]MDK8773578.1 ribosome maturation factor RimP [Corynebacterium imitans]
MAFPTPEQLGALVAPIARNHELDVEQIRAVRAGKKSQVVIALDGDTPPTLDELEVISNELSELFDAHEDAGDLNFGAGYTLEVTTPGVDMPLTEPRHWRRNRGRAVALLDADGKKELWRIGALDETETRVALIERGAKVPAVQARLVSEMPKAVVEIEFKAPPAAEQELVDAPFDEVVDA